MPVSTACHYCHLAYRWHPDRAESHPPPTHCFRQSRDRHRDRLREFLAFVSPIGRQLEHGPSARKSIEGANRVKANETTSFTATGRSRRCRGWPGLSTRRRARRGGETAVATAVRRVSVSANGRNVNPSLYAQVPDAAATVSPPGDGVPETTGFGGVWRWYAPQE